MAMSQQLGRSHSRESADMNQKSKHLSTIQDRESRTNSGMNHMNPLSSVENDITDRNELNLVDQDAKAATISPPNLKTRTTH